MAFPNQPTNSDDHEAEIQIEPERGEQLITISLIKQYTYCSRIVYYETCTPGVRPRTYKMRSGQDAHVRERDRAARRTLAAYQVPEGKRRFDVRLISPRMGLSGLIDEVVFTPDETIVVDYKLASWTGANHHLQVAAYSLLVEEAFGLPARRGFIYLLNLRRFESVPIDEPLRNSVRETIERINRIRLYEYMPPPAAQPAKCESCEFRRFCNDV